MKPKEIDYVRGTIENEGFDYAFIGYSEFKDIKDEEFHNLREAYIKAHDELMAYIGEVEE